MPDILSVDNFLKKLSEGKLKSPLVCTGVAKPIESNNEVFLFSLGISGVIWTKIYAKAVEKIEFLRECRCRDDLFPLVKIHFKEPLDNDPFAATFYSMLQTYTLSLDSSIITRPYTPVFMRWMETRHYDAEGNGGAVLGFQHDFGMFVLESEERAERDRESGQEKEPGESKFDKIRDKKEEEAERQRQEQEKHRQEQENQQQDGERRRKEREHIEEAKEEKRPGKNLPEKDP